MSWHIWCNAHDSDWYEEDDSCDAILDNPKSGIRASPISPCRPAVYATVKSRFDNRLELDISPFEREDISKWMKTRRS